VLTAGAHHWIRTRHPAVVLVTDPHVATGRAVA
jgi:hypothetical protein